MRILIVVVLVAAAALVALWQLGVIDVPFGGPNEAEQAQLNLFEAVQAGDVATLEVRASGGADVNARDAFGQTPLMYAVGESGNLDVAQTLLTLGADVNARTEAGWTPLMYAVRDAPSTQLPLLLLNAGADPTLMNADGEQALIYARENSAVRNSGLFRRLSELSERPFVEGWPSGYVVPVEGATLSSRANHLPGAPRSYRNGTHEGFDFYNGTVSVPIGYGTPIRAIAGGTVVRADHDYVEVSPEAYDAVIADAVSSLSTPADLLDKLRGRQVWIEHPGGFLSRYAHLSGIPDGVVVGAQVEQAHQIGFTGNSGTLEAAQGTEDDPHPHVELWRGDTYLGLGMEPPQIYELAAQLFGEDALPPFTGE
jgi:murein DD-endopeptidase MepM/ murein hydrolase activator NlpD